MRLNKDQILIRAKDITLVVTILTLLGFAFVPFKKFFQFDEAVGKIATIESGLQSVKQDVAVTNAQYAMITKQLEQINWQLRTMRGRNQGG